jgi:hypothetical protein
MLTSLLRPLLNSSSVQRFTANAILWKSGYKEAGKMTQLKIDPKTASIDAEVELKGEDTPVKLHIENYKFSELPDGSAQFSAGTITISKPWMEIIARNAMADRTISIPKDMAKWMKLVLA